MDAIIELAIVIFFVVIFIYGICLEISELVARNRNLRKENEQLKREIHAIARNNQALRDMIWGTK